MGSMKISDDAQAYYDKFVELCTKSEYIKWIKYLPNNILKKEMSKCLMYISFSNMESFGLTSAEAMSVGVPVLCTENAVAELVDEGSGLVIKKSDTYRKSKNGRFQVYEKYYQDLNRIVIINN